MVPFTTDMFAVTRVRISNIFNVVTSYPLSNITYNQLNHLFPFKFVLRLFVFHSFLIIVISRHFSLDPTTT